MKKDLISKKGLFIIQNAISMSLSILLLAIFFFLNTISIENKIEIEVVEIKSNNYVGILKNKDIHKFYRGENIELDFNNNTEKFSLTFRVDSLIVRSNLIYLSAHEDKNALPVHFYASTNKGKEKFLDIVLKNILSSN